MEKTPQPTCMHRYLFNPHLSIYLSLSRMPPIKNIGRNVLKTLIYLPRPNHRYRDYSTELDEDADGCVHGCASVGLQKKIV